MLGIIGSIVLVLLGMYLTFISVAAIVVLNNVPRRYLNTEVDIRSALYKHSESIIHIWATIVIICLVIGISVNS